MVNVFTTGFQLLRSQNCYLRSTVSPSTCAALFLHVEGCCVLCVVGLCGDLLP
jgi:hypothetical protein